MAGSISGIQEKQIKKKILIFGLEDTLIPGKIDHKVNMSSVYEILSNLKALEEKFYFHALLVSAYSEAVAMEKIKKFKLDQYFKPENIFTVTKAYIDSKEELDRTLYLKGIENDREFQDEFIKQVTIDNYASGNKVPKEQMLLIGHDLLLEGFYTLRYSQIDFALLKESLSYSRQKLGRMIKGVPYIRRKWPDIRDLILGKAKKPDYKFMESYVYSRLNEGLLGGTTIKAETIITKKPEAKAK